MLAEVYTDSAQYGSVFVPFQVWLNVDLLRVALQPYNTGKVGERLATRVLRHFPYLRASALEHAARSH